MEPSAANGEGGPIPAGYLSAKHTPQPDAVVDAVGLFCPVPIIRTTARVRRMLPGQILEVRADDPVTLVDLPNWCRGAGHGFLGWDRSEDNLRLFIEVGKRGPRPAAGAQRGNDGS